MLKVQTVHKLESKTEWSLPMILEHIPAGFPSPSDDHIDSHIDLNQHLIEHPESTYLIRVTGESMIGAGIFESDILIVDRSITATHNKVVIASVDGELLVKRISIKNRTIYLCSENAAYPPIPIESGNELMIWGVVTYVIHKPV